jgi:hypothetical protein
MAKIESQIKKTIEESNIVENTNIRKSISNGQASSSSYEKCISMMKNGEWALLETWLRNLTKIDFDINIVDKV